MWAVAGLGNPGRKYENTRHNLGFMAIDEMAGRMGALLRERGDHAFFEGFIGDEKIIFMKPLTFMNLSGRAVSGVLSYYRCPVGHLIVIHDDLDIEPGRMKISMGGGSGGHRGIESVIASTGSRDFLRIRIGIGRPGHGNVEGYVLGTLSGEERELVMPVVGRAAEAVETIISEGYQKAMSIFNAS